LSHYSQPLFTKTLLRIANGEDVAQDFETMYNFKKIIMLKQFTSSWTTEEAIARDVIEYI
jgi:hypothetical protein